MIKKLFTVSLIIQLIAVILLINPTKVFAAKIDKETLTQNQIFSITGSGFGDPIIFTSQICFDSTEYCLTYGMSPAIISWSNKLIEVTASYPTDIPIEGDVLIYNMIDGKFEKVGSAGYKYGPYIRKIYNKGEPIEEDFTLVEGSTDKEIVIEGYGFGSKRGNVSIVSSENEEVELKISKWKQDKITAIIPDIEGIFSKLIVKTSEELQVSFNFEVTSNIANDPYSRNQKYILLSKINEMWKTGSSKKNITVAVIDEGVYHNQEDLENKFWVNEKEILNNGIDDDENGYIDDKYGWNFINDNNDVTPSSVKNSHGTMVAGIIAANKDNGIGIAGIADKVKIMPLVACNSFGCGVDNVSKAIKYAVDNKARVINLSLGGSKITDYYPDYDEVIEYANKKNVILVISAGNGDTLGGKGMNTTDFKISPVCNEKDFSQIIGVGATTSDNKYRTNWTNYGNCVDVYAPGEKIFSTTIPLIDNENYEAKDGTSFSAPIVTGVIAYTLSIYPKLTPSEVREYLVTSSKGGILDAANFINKIGVYYEEKTDQEIKEMESNVEDEQSLKKINLQEEEEVFSDIYNSDFHEAIKYLKENNIIKGYEDGTFRPFQPINRSEFLKILMEALDLSPEGKNCFFDVQGEWSEGYVCKAKNMNIISGYSNGTFDPYGPISNIEALKILFNAYDFPIEYNKGDDWYVPYINYANEKNYYLDSFDEIGRKITREEMAELIYRVKQKENNQ